MLMMEGHGDFVCKQVRYTPRLGERQDDGRVPIVLVVDSLTDVEALREPVPAPVDAELEASIKAAQRAARVGAPRPQRRQARSSAGPRRPREDGRGDAPAEDDEDRLRDDDGDDGTDVEGDVGPVLEEDSLHGDAAAAEAAADSSDEEEVLIYKIVVLEGRECNWQLGNGKGAGARIEYGPP